MPSRRLYALWCPVGALALFAYLVVAAPSVVALAFDNAVSIGGMPAGLVVMATFWLVFSVVGLVAIRLTHRADARLGILVGMVVVAIIGFFLAPSVILVIKNLKV